ncbi:hypothetical protein BN1013_00857 [Candidatus Rubidus massiliensis]|nr:MAG: hypothetical protein BGO10_03315 [Chlamydia sp. 32-24]CDZ80347.1 hypothetical protein BN1013_00857 [Candidatus Rubidus massiliensis]
MQFSTKYFILLFLVCTSCLFAEVETVVIRWWYSSACLGSCVRDIIKYFSRVYGVAEVSVQQTEGQISIRWKPYVTFEFLPMDTTMRLIGLSIREIRVKVQGTIEHDVDNIWLVSTGDNTRFMLINPIIPVKNQYVEEHNPLNRGLNMELRNKFMDAQANGQYVTVEGRLFQPIRSPPLMLVVEKYTMTPLDVEKQMNPKPRTFGFGLPG